MFRSVGKLCGIVLLAGSSLAFAQQYTISTAAGGAPPPTPVAATSTSIGQPNRVTVDGSGNIYFSANNAVFKINAGGNLTVVAGNSRAGYSGDGGPAIQGQLNGPQGLALDATGNLYIADSLNNRVRIVSPQGVISTFAGTGASSPGGGGTFNDGGLAINALLRLPNGVFVDKSGNVYIADTGDNLIRKVTPNGIINSVAGDGFGGFWGDTAPAVLAGLKNPMDMTVDSSGNIFIADSANGAIREVTASTGLITTVVGTPTAIGDTGDGGPATSAALITPYSVWLDSSGNIYFVQNGDSRVRKVTVATGVITGLGGNQTSGYSGDGSTATKAQMNFPTGGAMDSSGNIYVADSLNHRIRKINNGTISTIAGNGILSYSGDGGPANSAELNTPQSVAVDSSGNYYIADTANNVVRKVTSSGTITTLAGTGTAGYGGDGGAASAAQLNRPQGVAVDSGGNVYVADSQNARIRKISAGSISTVAGNGSPGFGGDGGAATAAQLYVPTGVAVDSAGNLFIADFTNNRVRKVSGGAITTVAGNGGSGYSGDGGPAVSAQFNGPVAVALDSTGNLYIADLNNSVVREVSGGNISTIAGTGMPGLSGDGGPATAAMIDNPSGVAVDSGGNLYIASGSATIRKVYAGSGFITTIAGNGASGYSGDGGPATFGELNNASSVAVGPNSNIYVADTANNAIRSLVNGGFQLSIAAVANAGSNQVGSVSPGEILVLYGTGLSPAGLAVNQVGASGAYSTTFNGVTVFGKYPRARFLFIQPGRGGGSSAFRNNGFHGADLCSVSMAVLRRALPVTIAKATPGIFTSNSSGQGQAAALTLENGVTSYNGSTPANAGDYVELYITGAGQTSPAGVDGTPYGGPAACTLQSSVTIGTTTVVPQYCGGAPGQIAGLTQINVQVPTGLTAGSVPVSVTVGGVSAQSGVTISVSGH